MRWIASVGVLGDLAEKLNLVRWSMGQGFGSWAGGFRLCRIVRALAKSVIKARTFISVPHNG